MFSLQTLQTLRVTDVTIVTIVTSYSRYTLQSLHASFQLAGGALKVLLLQRTQVALHVERDTVATQRGCSRSWIVFLFSNQYIITSMLQI